ncbi:hypothetical protein LMG22037_05331 [Paraburkholderia phenoliruptrix]|uniref:Uncharacterized protein n=1 Tax=Paraburkholderia phenoliruptrix TaxID=252970 RepID=A0A6J5C8M9_9BURK|nr:hypothetical protein [Paraburkholderia phenoliruptrix]CAB3728000.1 hypothetical protein LMG22037_05331 [Paraburkholderia phenoliruptrix]
MLTIAIYDREGSGGIPLHEPLCELEGCVVRHDGQRLSLLEEACKVLEVCLDRYSTPAPPSDCFTVLVKRSRRSGIELVARINFVARNRRTNASVLLEHGECVGVESVHVDPHDDAATIVLQVVKQLIAKGW